MDRFCVCSSYCQEFSHSHVLIGNPLRSLPLDSLQALFLQPNIAIIKNNRASNRFRQLSCLTRREISIWDTPVLRKASETNTQGWGKR